LEPQLDVTKVMFAAGNGTERMRFAKFDVKDQVVADMFAGIGYFTLPVAKYGKPRRLIALEKNPNSAHFLRENIVLNKVSDIVTVYEGDNRETAEEWLGKCDRVFMGYLPSAEPFFPRALQLAHPRKCILHYHYFSSKEDSTTVPLTHLMPHLEAIGRNTSTKVTLLHIENVKNYAPHLWHYVADMLLEDDSS
jgi:tRNA wybutosine-synthesizing protein 2